jgi:hypothetical protein
LSQLRPRIRPLDELVPALGMVWLLLLFGSDLIVAAASRLPVPTMLLPVCGSVEAVAVAWLWPLCNLL